MDETIVCLLLDMLAMYMCWMKPFAMYMCWMIISIWQGYDLVCICVVMLVESIFKCVCVYVKLNEFKKKQGLYRLFVVCWQTAKSFAISQQTAKLPRGSYLCNLGHWLAYLVTLPSAG